MDTQMTKEQVIQATIEVLSNISVPVRLREITDKIEGSINNLVIVLQMIQAEKEMNEKLAAENDEEGHEGGTVELTAEEVGHPSDDPEEEA